MNEFKTTTFGFVFCFFFCFQEPEECYLFGGVEEGVAVPGISSCICYHWTCSLGILYHFTLLLQASRSSHRKPHRTLDRKPHRISQERPDFFFQNFKNLYSQTAKNRRPRNSRLCVDTTRLRKELNAATNGKAIKSITAMLVRFTLL